ncbi:MAG: ferritin-like domain-containing protein [Phycisphaerae bacterium]|jgi:rubrerythrin
MSIDQKTLAARLRQLLAADKNAVDIYSELSELMKEDSLGKVFANIAKDEKRHTVWGEEMLSLLENTNCPIKS